MASIFTFDPDPPRVASPWINSGNSTPEPSGARQIGGARPSGAGTRNLLFPDSLDDADFPILKLEPEPQDGPTEYKLHLLLRPRRSFYSSTTGRRVSGSARPNSLAELGRRSSSGTYLPQTPPLAASSQSRQHRLEQLTTQLLWRLQQSSPYHASAVKAAVLPSTPRLSGAGPLIQSDRIPPGLEESRGALYEIGVADDGTFVGLAQDELDESLQNLRAMAATLGCTVEVLRKVAVGDCEWYEDSASPRLIQDTLWVAEAFVKPDLGGSSAGAADTKLLRGSLLDGTASDLSPTVQEGNASNVDWSSTAQLRITLTGPTMSGKSSLLGCLTNNTLDNGRGKSRLGLLKHRHEIVSGMTSSVTQELLGYGPDASANDETASATRVVNYAAPDVTSWSDIHGLCNNGRLIFLSDSAGHPRYRRTIVRGLIGWAPHWTLLCVPADLADDTTGLSGSTPPMRDLLGGGTAEIDWSDAYLRICLDLHRPLMIAVTKFDLASKSGLRQLLAKLLTTLKAAGRKPVLVRDSPSTSPFDPDGLQIAADDLAEARRTLQQGSPVSEIVPILCTSAVSGAGIAKLHAILHELPLLKPEAPVHPPPRTAASFPPDLFHVEEVFGYKPSAGSDDDLIVVSGILRRGEIKIGDSLMLGPFQANHPLSPADSDSRVPPLPVVIIPGSLSGTLTPLDPSSTRVTSSENEWRHVKVVTLRNLRLPVRCLQADQVGTLGLRPAASTASSPSQSAALTRARKGMVLASAAPETCGDVYAEFPGTAIRTLYIGSMVVLYTASVRASAKITLMSVGSEPDDSGLAVEEDHGGAFRFELSGGSSDAEHDAGNGSGTGGEHASTIVQLRFIAARECVEPGAQIFVLPGGGPGLTGGQVRGERGYAGLEGFAGKVISVSSQGS